MRILYLVPHVPNPTKARSYFQIKGLVDAGHHVTVATLQRGQQDTSHVANLERAGIEVLWESHSVVQMALNAMVVLAGMRPMQSRLMWSPALWRKIVRHCEAALPDVVHVEHLRMAIYGLRLKRAWPVIWDAVDHLSSLYEQTSKTSTSLSWRIASRVETPLLQQYETWLTCQFPLTTVISRRDQGLFRAGNPCADRVHLLPPGLPITEAPAGVARAEKTVIITGTFNYHPNVASVVYFVREIWPLVLASLPDARLQVVGANPVPEIQALRSAQVEVTGFVPSVMEYLRQATVAVAPILYGTGVQNKVIEAFLAGTPVVATTIALCGLDVKPGEHVLVGDTPEEFAHALVRLLSDPVKCAQIGAAGRRYIEKEHNLVETTTRLLTLYEQARSLYVG
jgi:glycosyltransferase involved in cell wall biosynthesis